MFANILFLIISLLISSFNQATVHPIIQSPLLAFAISLGLYFLLLLFVVLEIMLLSNRLNRSTLLCIVNVQLVLYLLTYQFILMAGRIFYLIPNFGNFEIFNAVWLLSIYFVGLFTFYFFLHKKIYVNSVSEKHANFALRQIKFLIPFALPFLFFTLSFDIYSKWAGPQFVYFEEFTLIITFSFLILFFIYTPFFVQIIWGCKKLPHSHLEKKLIALCEKANFKHAGMHTWPIMQDQLTAAIIGVVPKYRYVMFTDRLLNEMSDDNIEAILAHEIGHSKHYHLIFYPLIFFGITLILSVLFPLISEEVLKFLEKDHILLEYLYIPIIFVIYCSLFILYFRFVFGFFSRIFERQADLHVFALDIPVDHLIQSFKIVAQTMGGYDTPNWHHYSIKERVEFLVACKNDSLLIEKHHKYVKYILFTYFSILITLFIILLFN